MFYPKQVLACFSLLNVVFLYYKLPMILSNVYHQILHLEFRPTSFTISYTKKTPILMFQSTHLSICCMTIILCKLGIDIRSISYQWSKASRSNNTKHQWFRTSKSNQKWMETRQVLCFPPKTTTDMLRNLPCKLLSDSENWLYS